MTIWKFSLTNKINKKFFQAEVVSVLRYGSTTWTLTKLLKKKLDGNCTRMWHAVLNKSWKQQHYKTAAVQSLTSSLANHPSQMNKLCRLQHILFIRQTHKWHSPMDSYIWTHQCWLTCKNLYLSTQSGHWMSSRGLAKSDGQ